MENKKQFTTAISNKEHLTRAEKVYDTEVRPFLEENRKAYKKYQQDKKSLALNPAQKFSLQCQSPV